MGKVEPINDIINEIKCNLKTKKIKNNEINEIVNDIPNKRKGITSKISYTEYVADKLVKIYNAPNSRKFFLKCAWNLSEDTIWTAVEDSRRPGVKSPIKLFVFICSNALNERPVTR